MNQSITLCGSETAVDLVVLYNVLSFHYRSIFSDIPGSKNPFTFIGDLPVNIDTAAGEI